MRKLLICGLAAGAVAAMCFVHPIAQNPAYHAFADRRSLFGIPNFRNVASNAAFLFAALPGLRALRRRESFAEAWERLACAIFTAAVAAVAFGSAFYHWRPDNAMLFWDRLPMTVAFLSLFASVIGERMDSRWGRALLFPLLAAGAASVLYWRATGDLRWYAMVQFFPALAIPLLIALFPPRYTGSAVALGGLIAGYAAAKLLEGFDRQIGTVLATGGHPWKHLAAAAGVWWYLRGVAARRLLKPPFRPR